MSKTETHYYIGEGVLHHKGKDIKHGQPLPADLPQATVDSMLKKGKASKTPPNTPGAAQASELGRLRDKVQELTVALGQASQAATDNSAEIERLQARVAQLEQDSVAREELLATTTGERDAARDSVANLEKTIAEMTAAATGAGPAAPAAPVETGKGAGPKK